MFPIINLNYLKQYWHLFEEARFPFYAALLYTDADENIAKYVRKYWYDLDELSERSCLVFAIEKPPHRANIPNWYEGTAFDRSEAYRLADWFSISPVQLPCIALFKNIDTREIVTVSLPPRGIAEELTRRFRDVFHLTKKHCRESNGLARIREELAMKKLKDVAVSIVLQRKIRDILQSLLDRYVILPS